MTYAWLFHGGHHKEVIIKALSNRKADSVSILSSQQDRVEVKLSHGAICVVWSKE